MLLFSGTSNLPLAEKVAKKLGIKLGEVEIKRFPDGECRVWVRENVKDKEVFILQSLSKIADCNLMELCLIGDGIKRLGAKKLTAVIPWLGYSKQDKEFRKGEAVSVFLVAKFLECAGFGKVISLDLHSQKIKEYFKIPVIELSARELLGKEIMNVSFWGGAKRRIQNQGAIIDSGQALRQTQGIARMTSCIVVSPDKGGVGRSEKFAKEEGLPIAHLDKTRDLVTNKVIIHGIDIDVAGKDTVIFDDIINTGGTVIETANFLHKRKAKSILFLATHAVLAGEASEKIQDSFIDKVVVTDTIYIPEEKVFPKLKIVSVADIVSNKLNSEFKVQSSKPS